jgi:hypothetical protein
MVVELVQRGSRKMLFVGPYAYALLKRHGVPASTIDENNTCQTDTQPANNPQDSQTRYEFIAQVFNAVEGAPGMSFADLFPGIGIVVPLVILKPPIGTGER